MQKMQLKYHFSIIQLSWITLYRSGELKSSALLLISLYCYQYCKLNQFQYLKQINFSGVLSIDEISVAPDYQYCTQTLRFKGIATIVSPSEDDDRFAQIIEDAPSCNPNGSDLALADHALVFMFRPLLAPWVQPFGVIASKGAVSGFNLAKLMRTAIVALENAGARVVSVVCDGASTNKAMWRLLGLDGENNSNFRNSIPNPYDPARSIRFFWDPPHAFKCIRNQLFNQKVVQVF